MNIGQNVKKIRESKKITQDKLASMLGYSHKSSINKIEMGKADISVTKLIELSDALEVSLAEIIGIGFSNNKGFSLYEDDAGVFEVIGNRFGSDTVELIKKYLSLNQAGQRKIIDDISDLAEIPKYTK